MKDIKLKKINLNRVKFILLLAIPFTLLIVACGDSFLDMKPDKRQRIPKDLEDYQAMLDHSNMNEGSCHLLGMIGGDEFTISEARWNAFPLGTSYYQKDAYIWESESYAGSPVHDYHVPYRRILMLNVVLDGVEFNRSLEAKKVKAHALFLRARWYSELLQQFSPVYEKGNAKNQLGLPMYLDSDVTVKIKRSNLKESYDQVIDDLKLAAEGLPEKAVVIQRPSRAAAYALLSRLYLQLEDYENSLYYSDESLKIQDELLDFNRIDLEARYPFPSLGINNTEILFMNMGGNLVITGNAYFNADKELLSSYEIGDLRKKAYFFNNSDGRVLFKGSYHGSYSFFTGLATDEMYLNRSESNARLGNLHASLSDLNYLRKHRIDNDHYLNLESADLQKVLGWVIEERKKELVMRGVRWQDLRRLNKESRHQTTLHREVGMLKFTLPPDDLRWTWKLPVLAIDLGGYEQNP